MGADEYDFQPTNDPVGVRLKRAREALGLSMADLVAHTHVQERFLLAIEAGNYAALPGRAYAFGFARSYAGYVGLDPDATIRDLRHELGLREQAPSDQLAAAFAPGDPARVPSARFAALAAAAAVLLAGGGYALWHVFSVPDASLPSLVTDTPTTDTPTATPQVQPTAPAPFASANATSAPAYTGPVVFTALDSGIWVKFYDASGKVLLQKQMAVGESYTIPADATAPMIWTGRPEALAVSIGGHPIGKLDETRKTVRDLPVSAAALQSRSAAAAPPPSVASGSAMGQADRAAMPAPAPIAQPPKASVPVGAVVPAHHAHRHITTPPSAAPSDGAPAAKASTVSP